MLGGDARQRGLRIADEIAPDADLRTDIEELGGDPGELGQVFSNLLANALRLTPVEGEIRVGIILMNVAILLYPPEPLNLLGLQTTYPNLLSVMFSTIAFAVLVYQVRRSLAELKPATGRSEA